MQDNNTNPTLAVDDTQIVIDSSNQNVPQSARVRKNIKRIGTYDKVLAVLNVANTTLMTTKAIAAMVDASDGKKPSEGLSGNQIGVQVVSLVGFGVPLLTTITANIIEKDMKRRQIYNKAIKLREDDEVDFNEQKNESVTKLNRILIGASAIGTAISYAGCLTYIGLEMSSIVYKAKGDYNYASTLNYTLGGVLFFDVASILLNEVITGIGQHFLSQEINTHIPYENGEEPGIISEAYGRVYNFFKSCCGSRSAPTEGTVNEVSPLGETRQNAGYSTNHTL